MSAIFSERARLAALSRSRTPDDPDLIAARVKLKGLSLEEHVARVVASAPPLTAEQRDRIAVLLRPSGGAEPPGHTIAAPQTRRNNVAEAKGSEARLSDGEPPGRSSIDLTSGGTTSAEATGSEARLSGGASA